MEKLLSVTDVLIHFSPRIRGLQQNLHARNIQTVGDLAALTALEVHSLPIRSPKMTVLMKALTDLERQRVAATAKKVEDGGGDAKLVFVAVERSSSSVTICVDGSVFFSLSL